MLVRPQIQEEQSCFPPDRGTLDLLFILSWTLRCTGVFPSSLYVLCGLGKAASLSILWGGNGPIQMQRELGLNVCCMVDLFPVDFQLLLFIVSISRCLTRCWWISTLVASGFQLCFLAHDVVVLASSVMTSSLHWSSLQPSVKQQD